MEWWHDVAVVAVRAIVVRRRLKRPPPSRDRAALVPTIVAGRITLSEWWDGAAVVVVGAIVVQWRGRIAVRVVLAGRVASLTEWRDDVPRSIVTAGRWRGKAQSFYDVSMRVLIAR